MLYVESKNTNFQAPNPKLQIPNKSQFSISKFKTTPVLIVSGIGYWNLFGIWNLVLLLPWTDPAPGSRIQEKMFREKTRQSRKETAKGTDRG
jgi:hypothetical protein